MAQYDWYENELLRQYHEQLNKDFSNKYFNNIQDLMFEGQKKDIDKALSIPILHLNEYCAKSEDIVQKMWVYTLFIGSLMERCNHYDDVREVDFGLTLFLETLNKPFISTVYDTVLFYFYHNLSIEHYEEENRWNMEVFGEGSSSFMFNHLHSYIFNGDNDTLFFSFGEKGPKMSDDWYALLNGEYDPDKDDSIDDE